ncbi:Hsp70 family protein [Amycolatopsis cynarae]|uniref:Hsp70 family protein n=1 Tax=Amycolatopsis cynarae TaxID=2995223 RepID=A0ABY7B2F9_9PSEU|nr:Hsp70 family protein [Amycolatopsis sp. HUAS 11-8]WAL65392.1 Hsp70 family protein [Amycolatopsis sp. HUAS 11-8]
MRYVLGIDIGTTRIKAAVCRRAGEFWGEPEVVTRSLEAVLHVAHDTTVQVGAEARRRAAVEPERAARGFLRRVGDDVPFLLGDELYRAESLTAVVAGWVADQIADAEGGDAERIAVTHPPGWGAYRRRLLHEALQEAGLPGALLLPAPVAAAENHLVRERVEPGSVLAVCRLGGEYVDTAVLRRASRAFEVVSHHEQSAPALDDALTEHVLPRFGGELGEMRFACHEAREMLSTETEIDLGGRFTRSEFERLIRPLLMHTLAPLRRYEGLSSVLLVGGTARTPLVEALTRELVDCRVVVDPDPATAACRGAALTARPPAEAPSESTTLVPRVSAEPAPMPEEVYDAEPVPPRPPIELTPLEPPRRRFVPGRRSGSRDEDDE